MSDNFVISRPGQDKLTGAVDATFQDIFSAEVMTAFESEITFFPRVRSQAFRDGKGEYFPVIGRNKAAFHPVGDEFKGSRIAATRIRITLDDIMGAGVWLSFLDEIKSHIDVRSYYVKANSNALSTICDQHIAATLIKAARSTENLAGMGGGTQLKDNGYATNADKLADALIKIGQTFNENDVPCADRYMAVRPAQLALLHANNTLHNRDYGGTVTIKDNAKEYELRGMTVFMSNNIPSTNITVSENWTEKYAGDYSKTIAIAWHKDAVGSLSAVDATSETEFTVTRQATFFYSKYIMGHGVLRPECAVELSKA